MNKGVIIAIVVGILLIAGIIYGVTYKSPIVSTNPSNETGPAPSSLNVQIKNFAFSPSTLTIKVGEKVTWSNIDNTMHTVTSDSGSELQSQTLNKGDKFEHTFTTAGTYTYHCNFHTSMKGTIIVQ